MSSILSEANKNQKPQGFCQNILSPRFGENRAQVKALDKMDSKITTVCFPKRPIKRLIVKLKIIWAIFSLHRIQKNDTNPTRPESLFIRRHVQKTSFNWPSRTLQNQTANRRSIFSIFLVQLFELKWWALTKFCLVFKNVSWVSTASIFLFTVILISSSLCCAFDPLFSFSHTNKVQKRRTKNKKREGILFYIVAKKKKNEITRAFCYQTYSMSVNVTIIWFQLSDSD